MSNKEKKYICFDIGNVLCHTNFDSLMIQISYDTGMTVDEAWLWLASIQRSHDLGLVSFVEALKTRFKLRDELTEIQYAQRWDASMYPNEEMFKLLEKLLKDGHEIALLSNMGTEHILCMEKFLSAIKNGDKVIRWYSAEVGARKPTHLFYQSFLSKYPEFKGAKYVDDLPENLETGKKHGFETINFALNKDNKVDMLKECLI
jgi:FMN phosphatase YigB (HAD superfamily)